MNLRNRTVKMDAINRKILTIMTANSNISNQDLAERVGLSNSACFQRLKALKEAGYFLSFNADVDLNRMVEHVLAYVEFKLENNSPVFRKAFEDFIEPIPEFMDCMRVTGDIDYVAFTCCSNTQVLNDLVDQVGSNEDIGVKTVQTRIILDRPKFYLGYPLDKLKWLDN
ncbi:MAG: Lrp/AsnC family transcriptional regulator [Erythrobacter sp.]